MKRGVFVLLLVSSLVVVVGCGGKLGKDESKDVGRSVMAIMSK